ncbi:peroxisomal membrane protein PEX13 [Uranotaenia lowii]|uniref:peroxisomal membrane protein PEX13 n=1 Tax=Uranotaenia lowii TaxID=190385 RepID=UPI00247AC37B|nr:peroxisomal membrane protein PEX13 [Uranotaenia lowii]
MQPSNFRSSVLNEPRIFGGQYGLNTPSGTIATNQAPPLPPRPFQQSYGTASYGQSRFGISPYGGGFSGLGGGGYYGGMYGGYGNVYGYGGSSGYGMGWNPEQRFIQMAEESSRPAFQNIESLVGAISNIAMMLDSTFFALTSSFRAVLGVAANFAHLRGVFAQFWTSFALFRWIVWSCRKVLYLLKITKTDPASESFTQAFKLAESMEAEQNPSKKGSSLPVMLFLGFIMSAPYLLMKLFGNKDTVDQTKNPSSWKGALEAVAVYNFDSSNQSELTIRAGQNVLIAPKNVQIDNNLLNTGWVLATVDNVRSGLIPISYVQGAKQQLLQQDQLQSKSPDQSATSHSDEKLES